MKPRLPHTQLLRSLILFCGLIKFSCISQSAYADNGQAADNAATGGIEVDFNSKYVWHGLVFTDEPVIQPSIWVSTRAFTFSIWNNQTPGSEDGFGTGDEIDLSVAYERTLGQFGSEFAFQYYTYPNQDDAPSTGELSARFSRVTGDVELATEHSLDVIEYGGAYFGDVKATSQREIDENLSYTFGVSLGWASSKLNETYAGVDQSALNLLGGAASVYWDVTEHVYLMPHLEIYRILNKSIADATQRNVFCLGAVIGIEL